MTATNISDELKPEFEKAFQRYNNSEELRWDLGFMAFPNPETGSMVGVLLLYAQIKGAVLGTLVTLSALMAPQMAAEEVDGEVREFMSKLWEQRSSQIPAMNDQQEAAYASGQPAPTGGLILP